MGGRTTLHNQGHTVVKQRYQPAPKTPICIITEEAQPESDKDEELSEVNIEALRSNAKLFTRMTEPHKPERVQELLRLVTIGEDLTIEERQKVQELISSFADVFALSVGEVKVVNGSIHHLKIPTDAKNH